MANVLLYVLVLVACYFSLCSAAKDMTTFSVLRFVANQGRFSNEGRMDPIFFRGNASSHTHGIMGGSGFNLTVEGDQLLDSDCTSSNIKADKSAYWVPTLYFQSPETKMFKRVPLYYINVYYFFEASNDDIKAFPVGLKMFVGNSTKRDPPASGSLQLDPSQGEVQPVQWSCPVTVKPGEEEPPRYPMHSDGRHAGMQDANNMGAGAGFPVINCDGLYSPLRQDMHFPSCYNPAAGLDDYENNMRFPTGADGGKVDCPKGWIHVPHLFYEVYWDTQQFMGNWTVDHKTQPFVLSNGDRTGYGSHGDMISGWDETTLQAVIDRCNTGTSGMNLCPADIIGEVNMDDSCERTSAFPDPEEEWLESLPGDNPLSGWEDD